VGTENITPEWGWLQTEFSTVNRNVTPWLIVLLHCPWYNSNAANYMQGESMPVVFEHMFVTNEVDVVFTGHFHAYECTVSPLFVVNFSFLFIRIADLVAAHFNHP
jgi:hypothetical protein